jgi:hypothetical protein
MFPPGRLVTPWIRFKVMSTGVNVARRLWDQREEQLFVSVSLLDNDMPVVHFPNPQQQGATLRSNRMVGIARPRRGLQCRTSGTLGCAPVHVCDVHGIGRGNATAHRDKSHHHDASPKMLEHDPPFLYLILRR